MPTTRIPLAEDLTNRDPNTAKDSRMTNCYVEKDSNGDTYVVKRAGTAIVYTVTAGNGLGNFGWNGHLYTVTGTTLYKDGVLYGTVDGTSQYQFTNNSTSTAFVMKNNSAMYVVDGVGGLTKVTNVNYPATTVPGVVYLDGYFFVMTPTGQIFNSAIQDPTTWTALGFISMGIDPGQGVGIYKQLNYIVAFGTRSTEVFYDAANPSPGSPLGSVTNSYVPMGCTHAGSVAQMDGTLFYMAYNGQRGRSIVMLSGLSPQRISTPFVERLLDQDTLSGVYSYCIKFKGHTFYVLSLLNTDITLLYQVNSGVWSQLTTTTINATKSVTSLTYSGGIVTAVVASHGYSDGQPVTISGATPAGYNGTFTISVVDSNTFTYTVSSALTTPATGTITSANYTEGHFKFINYTFVGNTDYLQHETDGDIYTFNPTQYLDDNVNPICARIRTPAIDFGNNNRKFYNSVMVIGDRNSNFAYIRHSDDDFQTYNIFRQVDLSNTRPQIRRNGSSRRRAWEIQHNDNGPMRLKAMEISVESGAS